MARTVLIVDDHDAFRAAARALLELDGFTVVGEAGDGSEALLECARVHPDVVLLDVLMPDADGFEIARLLTVDGTGPAVVLTSTRDASAYARRLATTPARGFLPKHELSGRALTRILEGLPADS